VAPTAIVCTHGMNKKSQRTPQEQIDRLVRLHDRYQQAKADGQLKLAEDSTS